LKIYGLLTIPTGTPPEGGWPVIIFNHGYIPPEQYRTTQRYEAYVGGFARQGFVVFKPDYRGHGNSEGDPQGAYYSDAYIADVMNAMASVKKMPEVNPDRVGMWGHSMGGHLTLRAMVISKDVKAGVIWAGVVGSYQDMIYNWRRSRPWQPSTQEQQSRRPSRQALIDQFGGPDANTAFWDSISPIKFVSDISGPVQIHHGTADGDVPWEFSQSLEDALEAASKPVELYLYEGADHNLSGAAFSPALNRSVEFFKTNL
jgi:dipeptidyl aminopeptidase/acylaminoacyl peptidase